MKLKQAGIRVFFFLFSIPYRKTAGRPRTHYGCGNFQVWLHSLKESLQVVHYFYISTLVEKVQSITAWITETRHRSCCR